VWLFAFGNGVHRVCFVTLHGFVFCVRLVCVVLCSRVVCVAAWREALYTVCR